MTHKVILKNTESSVTVQMVLLFARPTPWNTDLWVIFSSSYGVFKTFMHKEQPHTSNLNDILLEKQKRITETLQESLVGSLFVLQTHTATLKDGIE